MNSLMVNKRGPISYLKDQRDLVLHDKCIKSSEREVEMKNDTEVLIKKEYST